MDEGTEVAGEVVRLVAPNPSALTGRGTNTYLVGRREIAVIDPGPVSGPHLAAILAAVPAGGRITQILVTHTHLDHSPGARALADATAAPVLAFGGPAAGQNPAIAALGDLGGGEGIDHGFAPDVLLSDADLVAVGKHRLRAIHTPGHLGNHLCFAMGDVVFSGDHVMGWATTLVSPPDGDMAAYMASLERLATHQPRRLLPGHGETVEDASARIAELAAHRRAREAAILAALREGPATPSALARRIYTGLSPMLLPAAERNVLAHLIDLAERSLVTAEPAIAPKSTFRPR